MDTSPHDNPNAEALPAQDAALSAALDRALAPAEPPAGLADRIMAATAGGHRVDRRDGGGPVLARIGAARWYGAAAAVLLVVILGEMWWAEQYVESNRPTVAARQPDPAADHRTVAPDPASTGPVESAGAGEQLAAGDGHLAAALDRLAAVAGEAEALDQRLGLLAMQVTLTDHDGFWAEAGTEALQDAAAAAELEELSHDLELYF